MPITKAQYDKIEELAEELARELDRTVLQKAGELARGRDSKFHRREKNAIAAKLWERLTDEAQRLSDDYDDLRSMD